MLLYDVPLAVICFVHFKHNSVSPVIRYIYMKQTIGSIGDHSEIEFSHTVGSFDEFGEANIFDEGEVHGVRFAG